MAAGFHPYAWTLWLAASMAAVLLTRNPLYLFILLAALFFLYAALLRRAQRQPESMVGAQAWAWRRLVYLALILGGFSIIFNALTVHAGERALFALPDSWPVVGGPITWESIIYGFVTGLSFVSLILIFAIYNSVLGPQIILRMIPGFAYQAGMAVSIAISFAPQTLIAWGEIREAQRLRGRQGRGVRDLLPLFLSLLSHGLDRAIQLAESMEARGFGSRITPVSPHETWLIRGGAILGLLALLAGLFVRAYGSAARLGLGLLLLGGLLLAFSLWRSSRQVQRSRYRRWLWRPRDAVLMGGAGLLLAGVLLTAWLFPAALFYYPYPPYDLLPSFNPFLGLLFALPLLPALLM